MKGMTDQESRAERARARAARMTVQALPLGSPEDMPPRGATLSERFAAIWPLTLRVWALSGREVVVLPRSQWPGRVIRRGIVEGEGL